MARSVQAGCARGAMARGEHPTSRGGSPRVVGRAPRSEVRGVSGVSLLGVLRRPAEPHQRRTRNALPGLWRQTRQRRLQSGVRRSAPLVTLRGRVVGGVQAMVIRRGPVARSGRGSPRSGRPRAPDRKSASRRSGPGCLPCRRRGPRGLREGRKSRSSVSR